MKKTIALLLIVLSINLYGQDSGYSIESYFDEGFKAPNTHYIGEAWLQRLLQGQNEPEIHLTKATFKANSTLDWHKHASYQILIYVEGEGYYQERGKEPIILKKGDIVTCPKETEHWHSSTKESDVTYLAFYAGDNPTEWTEVLTQKYYDEVAEKLKN